MSDALLEPFSVTIDFGTGALVPDPDVLARRLADLDGYFLADITDPEVGAYTVHEVRVPKTGNNLLSSTTVLEPGKVGDEYFFTKGHFHANRDRAEIYLTLSGEGVLVMALDDGRTVTKEMRPGVANYVPGHWAHRSVNTGTTPLVFYAVYIGDAGYDYATIAERGFPVIVVEGNDGPQVQPNPRYVTS
ncbi:MAG: cupin domain-containing protein [Actinobacteria bacterium]|nr:cupin domain-containing protein [Actinomycetota bacterium]